ncbi:AMP-binding protein [Microbacterium sp. NPDC055910]|uniref:AMP-binding protein n=1 Tax=Microbacterium sp. NPDC055910 TaxID=3345659 RepID=UPI0035E31265
MSAHTTETSAAVNYTPLTPLSFLRRSAEVFPTKEAIVYGARRWDYAAFRADAESLATAIRARIHPGDRVAFLAPNIPETLIAHFAVPLARGVLVTLNSRLSAAEIGYILEHSGAKLLFVDAELLATAEAAAEALTAPPEIISIADPEFGALVPEGATSFTAFVDSATHGDPESLSWEVCDELETISINYTSGTTGRPKGVMYSHRGAYLNALGELIHNGFGRDSTYLWTLPMFHCNGWCTPWAVTAAAATHVCLRAVRPQAVWDAIDEHAVTNLCGSPTVCSTIANADQAHPLDRRVRITTAGSAPSPTIIELLERLNFDVVHVYGLTEVYGPFTINEHQPAWDELPAADRADRVARQGVAMIQADAPRIVDEDMNDVPRDGVTVGEIVLRGNNVMLGYFHDDDATAAAFAGGWFHSGDLGVMHPDGYVELKDRAKDIIISGGENISTIEVENAILSFPAVLDVAVIGIPHERWGERPLAYVVARPGLSVQVGELLDHVRGRLAGFKVPDAVRIVEELPRTATGKVQKFELRNAG